MGVRIFQQELVNNSGYQVRRSGQRFEEYGGEYLSRSGALKNDRRGERKTRGWGRTTKEREENKRRVPNPIDPIPTHEVTEPRDVGLTNGYETEHNQTGKDYRRVRNL